MDENGQLWQQVENKFDCDHTEQKLCYRPNSNQYVMQCQTCGWTGNAIGHDYLTDEEKGTAGKVEQGIREAWYERRREYADRLRNENKRDWFTLYNEYLRTPEWKEKRAQVLRRDGYMCTACGNAQASQVHHLSYKYGRYTPLWLLQSVCVPCHETLTAIDRGNLDPWQWDEIEVVDELAY